MFRIIQKGKMYLALFLLTIISAQAQSEQLKELFQAVDQSITGVKITSRSTTITPKEQYNKKVAMRRNNVFIRQRQTKERAAQLGKTVEVNYPNIPMATEDVYKIVDNEILYANGKTQITAEISPDSAGGGQFLRQTSLYGLNEDVSIIFSKISKETLDPEIKPFATIEKKQNPTNLFSKGAHTFGRGLSSFSGTEMVMSKDTESTDSDKYIISIEAGSDEPEFTHAYFHVDKSKGFCWTDAYFFNQEGLKEEIHASGFQLVDGLWFPFQVETISYLPESEWTVENKIRRRSISEITSVEISQNVTLDAENLITPEMRIHRR